MSLRRNGVDTVAATLDLHGFTKDKAIKHFTDFIASTKWYHLKNTTSDAPLTTPLWAEVITGSGSHSSNGPILRDAIRALLDKRKMVYTQENAGSFLVNVMSGYELHPSPSPRDSKVTFVSQDSDIARVGMSLKKKSVGEVKRTHTSSTQSVDGEHTEGAVGSSNSIIHEALTPAEVRADDENLMCCKKISIESLTVEKKKKEEEERQENELISKAMEESVIFSGYTKELEEEAMQKALWESQNESKAIRKDEEEELQKALQASVDYAAQIGFVGDEKYDEMLQVAMDESNRTKKTMEEEEHQNEEYDERMVQEALKHSLRSL